MVGLFSFQSAKLTIFNHIFQLFFTGPPARKRHSEGVVGAVGHYAANEAADGHRGVEAGVEAVGRYGGDEAHKEPGKSAAENTGAAEQDIRGKCRGFFVVDEYSENEIDHGHNNDESYCGGNGDAPWAQRKKVLYHKIGLDRQQKVIACGELLLLQEMLDGCKVTNNFQNLAYGHEKSAPGPLKYRNPKCQTQEETEFFHPQGRDLQTFSLISHLPV